MFKALFSACFHENWIPSFSGAGVFSSVSFLSIIGDGLMPVLSLRAVDIPDPIRFLASCSDRF